jgi:DNA-binding NarL/FixJ family response regulator
MAFMRITVHELEIMRLVAAGKSNKEISVALENAEQTVKNSVSHLFDKLGINSRSRTSLGVYYIELIKNSGAAK